MKSIKFFTFVALIGILLASLPAPAAGQAYPDRPITIYCSYAAGATTDLTTRALAEGVEKILGVPVVVENKTGGTSTVCAGLVASKKPDGYTLGVISTGALTLMPHMVKLSYNPLKDFTPIMQYSRFLGGLTVLSESPIKTVDDFIAHAKANPGLSYGSPGMYSQQHLAVELFGQCKGLKLKHVPFKGGAESNTALLGKHLDFVAGSGQHVRFVKQGIFRVLLIYNSNKRDPNFPNIPTQEEIGCQDYAANGMMLAGPKGIPEAMVKKLEEAFKKVSEAPPFHKLLDQFDLPYDYKGRAELEKEMPLQYEAAKNLLMKMGFKKEG
jgi:tripartite-type tricarboxylate transporter receptor subunit TctC